MIGIAGMGGAGGGTRPRSNDPRSLSTNDDASLIALRSLESKDASLRPRRACCRADTFGTADRAATGSFPVCGDAALDCSDEMGLVGSQFGVCPVWGCGEAIVTIVVEDENLDC